MNKMNYYVNKMNYYYLVVLLIYYRCESVVGQIPPIFGSENEYPEVPPIVGAQNEISLTPFIVNDGRQNIVNPGNNRCVCTLPSACTGVPIIPGRDNFDIRIVNTGPVSPESCPTNYVLCCSGVPQQTNPVCGRRKVNLTSGVGDIAPPGYYPWHAALFNKITNQFVGAGVIISSTHILTAAHKVNELNNNFRVRLGLWTFTDNPNSYFEADSLFTIIHPNFNLRTLQNDIAIIQINRAIPFNNYLNINTACLPTAIPAPGTRCWTSGWGVNSFNNGQYQNPLRQVEVPIMDLTTCETRLRTTRLGVFYNLDRISFLCAGGEFGKDACTGDGGGALVCQIATGQFQVVGLTSWGIGCGQTSIPGIYVNVYSYLQFIRNQVSVTANPG